MVKELKSLEAAARASKPKIKTRIIEVPVFYRDPWIARDRRCASASGTRTPRAPTSNTPRASTLLGVIEDFHRGALGVALVSMVGFVAGLPPYQMVERQRQIEVPKYLAPHRHAEADGRLRRLLRLGFPRW